MALPVLCCLLVVTTTGAIRSDQVYSRFILDGREEDYLLLENDAQLEDSAEDEDIEDDTRPGYGVHEDLYAEEEENEYDRMPEDPEKKKIENKRRHRAHRKRNELKDHQAWVQKLQVMKKEAEADIVLHSPWAPRYDPKDEYEPRCPPPPAVGSNCGAPICNSDRDCHGTGPKKMCCSNGCVRTCAEPAPPPIEIDWVDRHSSIYDTMSQDPSLRLKTAPQHVAQAPQMVTMAGGCVLTLKQFKELAGFSKNENINRCFCEKGGVYCEVSRKTPAKD